MYSFRLQVALFYRPAFTWGAKSSSSGANSLFEFAIAHSGADISHLGSEIFLWGVG